MKSNLFRGIAFGFVLMVLLTACSTKPITESKTTQVEQEKKEDVKETAKSDDKVDVKQDEKKEDQKDDKQPEPVKEEYGDREFKVVAPAGVPTISIVKMMKDSPEVNGAKFSYESITATDTIAPKLISGEADFAIVPSNLAIKVYNKAPNYLYAGSTVWGVLYLASADDSVKSWEDLKGKTVTLIGRGLTPDLTLRYLMQQNGLVPDTDVTFEYVAGATELAPLFISGKASVALLPEPMLTQVLTKKPETKVVFDIQEEWKKNNDGESYPQTAVLIRKEVVEMYPELAKQFLDKLVESIEFANTDAKTAGQYMEEFNSNLKAGVITKAIPNCNLEFKNSKDARKALEIYYSKLMEFGAEHIGGKMPDENFYY